VIVPDKLADTCATESDPVKQMHTNAQTQSAEARIRAVTEETKNRNLNPKLPTGSATLRIFPLPNSDPAESKKCI
jgi:hypothetical protein